ncbi:MAG: hypothetical protein V1779_05020 [bacterium]
MKTKLIIGFILLITISACHPDIFYLNRNVSETEEISGFIIGSLDSVEQFAKNGMMLYSGSMIDMYCNEIPITQFQADFTTELNRGSGLSFSFRTIIDHFELHPNITFEYSTNGCKVFDSGKLLTNVDSIKAEINKPARIIIENYGKLFNIVVDCDTVFYGRTELHATQHMILKPFPGSDIRLTGIRFNDLNSDVRIIKDWKIEDFLSGE